MIKLYHSKAEIGDIHISNLYQVPTSVFEKYWNGSSDDYREYQKNYGLDLDWNVENLDQLHNLATQSFVGFEKAINRNISQFNFLLRSAIKPRNLPPLDLNDYMKLEIDCSDESEETKQQMKDKFFKMTSRSMMDFRELDGDKMIIIYNRRGIVNEDDRIAILKSKPSITLKDNFRVAKDSNFIVSGIIKDIATPNTEFIYNYATGADIKELRADSNEILNLAQTRETIEQKPLPISQEENKITSIAKQEIKKQNTENRRSLIPDSTPEEIVKEGTSNIKMQDSIDSTLADYEAKEIEKIKQRLLRGREMAESIYKELRLKIDEGMGILEALNILKQKYREEHAVNMASVYLGKDLQDLILKERTIFDLQNDVLKLQEEIKSKDLEISKREDSLYNLRSSLTQKENEFRLFKEETENTIEELQAQTKITIHDLTESFENQKEDLEESLLMSDEIIAKQDTELNLLRKQSEEYKNLYMGLQTENKQLLTENTENKTNFEHLEKEFKNQAAILKEINELKEKLVVENKELYSQNALMQKSLDELENILKDLKSKNKELESKIETLNSDYKNLTNRLLNEIKDEISKNSELGNKIQNKQKSRVSDILEPQKVRKNQ